MSNSYKAALAKRVDEVAPQLVPHIKFNDKGAAPISREVYDSFLPEALTPEIMEQALEHNLMMGLALTKASGIASNELFEADNAINETHTSMWMGHKAYSYDVVASRSKEVPGGMSNVDGVMKPNERKTVFGHTRSKLSVNAGSIHDDLSKEISEMARERFGSKK